MSCRIEKSTAHQIVKLLICVLHITQTVAIGALDVAAVVRVTRDFMGRHCAGRHWRIQAINIETVRKRSEIDFAVGYGGRNAVAKIEVIRRVVFVCAPEQFEGVGAESAQRPANHLHPSVLVIRNGRPKNAVPVAVGRDRQESPGHAIVSHHSLEWPRFEFLARGVVSEGLDIILLWPNVDHGTARSVPINWRAMDVMVADIEKERNPAQPSHAPRSRSLKELDRRVIAIMPPVALLETAKIGPVYQIQLALLSTADDLVHSGY